jgi:phage N-6-adenine-methyltransferase
MKTAITPRDKGKTRQDYETPDNFSKAVSKYFDFEWDVAACSTNAKCQWFIDLDRNSFKTDWSALTEKWCWLNPPFNSIKDWCIKCFLEKEKGAHIVMLTPASVGSNWFRDYIFNKTLIVFLNGRLTFIGEDKPYPKDCMITVWSKSVIPQIKCWNWKAEKFI